MINNNDDDDENIIKNGDPREMFVSFIYFRNGNEPYVISRNMNECDYLSGLSIKWDHQNTHVANVYFFLFSAIGYVDRVSNVIFCVVMLIFGGSYQTPLFWRGKTAFV